MANADLFDYKADLEIEDELTIEQLSEFSKSDFEALNFAAQENNNKAIFDSEFYLEEYPSVEEAGVNPYANYEAFGTDGDRYPNPTFKAFCEFDGALVASAEISDQQFEAFKESAFSIAEDEPEILQGGAGAGTFVRAAPYIIQGIKALIFGYATYEAIEGAKNFEELIEDSEIRFYGTPPFPGTSEESASDNNTGDSETVADDEIQIGTEPFDLGELTKIEPESIPDGNDFIEGILNGQFEFPAEDEIGFSFFDAAGREGNIIGDLREQAVADLLGVKLIKDSNGQDITAFEEGASESLAIDVFGPNGELILVGGPKKVTNFSVLGQRIRDLKLIAEVREVKAQYYYAEGTAESVIKFTEKRLGAENVFTFPEVKLP